MDQLTDEKRMIYTDYPADWEKYRFSYMTHIPKGMEPEDVYQGNNLIKGWIYRFPVFQYRMIRSFLSLRKAASAYAVEKLNKALKASWLNSHYHDRFFQKSKIFKRPHDTVPFRKRAAGGRGE